MCNDYGNRIPPAEYPDAFSQLDIPFRWAEPGRIPNLEPRDEVWPSETAPVVRAAGAAAELVELTWGFPPPQPKRPLVINMRGEGRDFTRNRCLIPASHFFEFTGDRSPKTRWRFTLRGADWFCIAGLWCRTPDGDAFTMLTVEPGPDVAPYHDRQIVILPRERWAAWLDPSHPAAELVQPLPAGSLDVREDPRVGPIVRQKRP